LSNANRPFKGFIHPVLEGRGIYGCCVKYLKN
jgi:hypothetical protein